MFRLIKIEKKSLILVKIENRSKCKKREKLNLLKEIRCKEILIYHEISLPVNQPK